MIMRDDLVAVLDVSSCRADQTEGFVNLIAMAVNDAAARIEADYFRSVFARAAHRSGSRGRQRWTGP